MMSMMSKKPNQQGTSEDNKFDAAVFEGTQDSLTNAFENYTTHYEGSIEHAEHARQKYDSLRAAGKPANESDAKWQEERRDKLRLSVEGIQHRLNQLRNIVTAPRLNMEFAKVAIDITCIEAMCLARDVLFGTCCCVLTRLACACRTA
jgi:hypothetical protein